MAFDYEVLVDHGSAGFGREQDYTETQLTGDLGDGFAAFASVGNPYGIYRFALTWKGIHRDRVLIQPRTYLFATIGAPVNRLRYLRDFVFRQVNVQPGFWMKDLDEPIDANRQALFCRLIEPKLIQTQSGKPLEYSYTLKIQQWRGGPTQL